MAVTGLESMGLTPKQFYDLVLEYEQSDPIDFGLVSVREEEAFRIICEAVIEIINNQTSAETREIVLAVSLAKVLVENMILQLQRVQDADPATIG